MDLILVCGVIILINKLISAPSAVHCKTDGDVRLNHLATLRPEQRQRRRRRIVKAIPISWSPLKRPFVQIY